MFLDNDLDPKTKKPKPRVLDNLSVNELEEYKADLAAEIIRVEAEISHKQAHKSAVDSLFKAKE
jgi:uncharacterized small protein (DUF1192 family)